MQYEGILNTMPPGCGALLETLAALINKYGKKCCYPSQDKLRELLATYHGLVISKSTLNRYLKRLQENGLIHRIKRHREGEDGKILFCTTAYYLCRKVVNIVKSVVKRVKIIARAFRVSNLTEYIVLHNNILGQKPKSADSLSPPQRFADSVPMPEGLKRLLQTY